MLGERLFWDNARSNAELAKRRAKPKILGVGRINMTPDEVIQTLEEELNVKISRRTLLNYEKLKLISEPKRGGAGKGKGRTTDYPDDAVAEAYAAWKLMHGDIRLNPSMISEIRNKVNGYVNRVLQEPDKVILLFDLNRAWFILKHLVEVGYFEEAKMYSYKPGENSIKIIAITNNLERAQYFCGELAFDNPDIIPFMHVFHYQNDSLKIYMMHDKGQDLNLNIVIQNLIK